MILCSLVYIEMYIYFTSEDTSMYIYIYIYTNATCLGIHMSFFNVASSVRECYPCYSLYTQCTSMNKLNGCVDRIVQTNAHSRDVFVGCTAKPLHIWLELTKAILSCGRRSLHVYLHSAMAVSIRICCTNWEFYFIGMKTISPYAIFRISNIGSSLS